MHETIRKTGGMNKKSLTRSIPFWLLLALSIVSAAVGAWLIVDQIGTMTATLLDGSATGVDVYVGQSWIVLGSALVGAGLVGLLLALTLAAARALLPVPATAAAIHPIETGHDLTTEPVVANAHNASGTGPDDEGVNPPITR